MKITAILLTLLYAASALAGQPYVQPMEPSNDDNVTLLPAPGGKVILDGDAYFSLPDGNKRSLRGLDGTVNDLSERFDGRDSYRLRYERLPTKAVEEIKENQQNIKVNTSKVVAQTTRIDSLHSDVEANKVEVSKLNSIGNIKVLKKRVFTVVSDKQSRFSVSCPVGHILLASICMVEIPHSSDFDYFDITYDEPSSGAQVSCDLPNPKQWLNVVSVCVDLGLGKIKQATPDGHTLSKTEF